ncbi:unnamed protein product [Effrenium voratum]|nr:unnamed protein product [Effrenium voratum]
MRLACSVRASSPQPLHRLRARTTQCNPKVHKRSTLYALRRRLVSFQRNSEAMHGFTAEERKLLEGTWPMDLLEDPLRQPRVVTTAAEFLREVLISDHLGDFLVLPRGVELLGLTEEAVMPADLRKALDSSSTVEELLRYFRRDEKLLDKYKAGVEYIDETGEQRMALPKERRNLRGRIDEVLRLVDSGEADPQSLYVAEMRVLNALKHPIDGELVKTVCQRDVKDVLGPLAAWTFYWDRHDEGVFIGNRGSGKGVHVDQVLWSNVGKNWRGYKLVAAWPKGAVSNKICTDFDDQLFSALSPAKLAALRQAAKLVLLRPGDVYLFSGGTAHTALCLSGLGLSSYESIVTLHPLHSGLCMQTCDRSSPCWLEGAMPRSEFEDILEEAAEQLERAASQLLKGGPGVAGAQEVEPSWRELRLQLVKDGPMMRRLQEYFAATVALGLSRSRFLRENAEAPVKRALRHLTHGKGLQSPERSGRSESPDRDARAPPDRVRRSRSPRGAT